MVEKTQKEIEQNLGCDNRYSGYCKVEIENEHCGKQKGKECEQNSPQNQLVEIVVARIDSIAQNVVFLAPEQMEKVHKDV